MTVPSAQVDRNAYGLVARFDFKSIRTAKCVYRTATDKPRLRIEERTRKERSIRRKRSILGVRRKASSELARRMLEQIGGRG